MKWENLLFSSLSEQEKSLEKLYIEYHIKHNLPYFKNINYKNAHELTCYLVKLYLSKCEEKSVTTKNFQLVTICALCIAHIMCLNTFNLLFDDYYVGVAYTLKEYHDMIIKMLQTFNFIVYKKFPEELQD